MKQIFHWVILFNLIVLPGMIIAQDSNAERTAATLFHNQQYQGALETWKKMVNSRSNAGLYFNIGLAESKLNHTAPAVYAYEQALRICPLNSSYTRALEAERKKMDNPVIPLNTFFLNQWYLGWITLFRPGVWALLGLVMLSIALFFYLVSIKALSWKINLTMAAIRGIGIVGLVFLVTSVLSAQHLFKQDEGIIMKTCELRQASSTESPALRQMSAGEKVKIKDRIGDWYYVALLNLDYGWIQSNNLSLISLAGSR